MLSSRERFHAMLFAQHPLPADAVVVLAGQDGQDRLQAGVHAFAQSARMIQESGGNAEVVQLVITGGVTGDGVISAEDLEPIAWQYGVAPSRVIVDRESQNTREQAVYIAKLCRDKGWRRILVAVSPYHAPRAYLTILKALKEIGADVQVIPAMASHLKWKERPDGCKYTRDELLSGEAGKIAAYAEHVASYDEGIESLKYWEGR